MNNLTTRARAGCGGVVRSCRGRALPLAKLLPYGSFSVPTRRWVRDCWFTTGFSLLHGTDQQQSGCSQSDHTHLDDPCISGA